MPSGFVSVSAAFVGECSIDRSNSRKRTRPRTQPLPPLLGCRSISGKRQKASRRPGAGGLSGVLLAEKLLDLRVVHAGVVGAAQIAVTEIAVALVPRAQIAVAEVAVALVARAEIAVAEVAVALVARAEIAVTQVAVALVVRAEIAMAQVAVALVTRAEIAVAQIAVALVVRAEIAVAQVAVALVVRTQVAVPLVRAAGIRGTGIPATGDTGRSATLLRSELDVAGGDRRRLISLCRRDGSGRLVRVRREETRRRDHDCRRYRNAATDPDLPITQTTQTALLLAHVPPPRKRPTLIDLTHAVASPG